MKRTLVMMAKQPVAGAVKTRLARDIGTAEALRFYRTNLRDTVRRLAPDPRWQFKLAVAPANTVHDPIWPGAIDRSAQVVGNLGTKMQGAMDEVPLGSVVIIGSDIPWIKRSHIWRAFKALNRADSVFGPSPDGGYWLVGARRIPKKSKMFGPLIRWSTNHALADTIKGLPNLSAELVDSLSDVDSVEEWRRWRATS